MLEDFMILLDSAKSIAEIETIMMRVSKKIGCDFIFYNIQIDNSFEDRMFLGVGNFPKAWIERYDYQDYAKIDPVLLHTFNREDAVYWQDIINQTDIKVVAFFQDAMRYGIVDGVSCGMQKSPGEVGIITLATKDKCFGREATFKMIIKKLQPVLHENIIRLSKVYKNAKKILLTQRENEVLGYLIEGESAKEIAKNLFITESTATFHIKNIIEKLDAKNRTQAVARAIMIGLVVPKNHHDSKSHTYRYGDV